MEESLCNTKSNIPKSHSQKFKFASKGVFLKTTQSPEIRKLPKFHHFQHFCCSFENENSGTKLRFGFEELRICSFVKCFPFVVPNKCPWPCPFKFLSNRTSFGCKLCAALCLFSVRKASAK